MKKLAFLLALLMLLTCCAACGEKTKEKAASATAGANAEQTDGTTPEVDPELCPETEDGKHRYEDVLVGEPTCVEPGLTMHMCSACGYSITSEIPALGHEGTGASCDEPSMCTVCGGVAEDPWGHDGENGFCKNCGIDMTLIPVQTVPAEPVETGPEEAEEIETTEAAEQQ